MEMNILVTLDKGYLRQLTVMLYSLQDSNPNETFAVYVMNSSLTAEDLDWVQGHLPAGRCRLIDVKVPDGEFSGAPVTKRYPKEMYYRIFAARYLPRTMERILYLDPDLVVINSLSRLWKEDLDGYYFAAASHVWNALQKVNEVRLQLDDDSPYINSGVLLMNLELLRREQDEKEVYEYIEEFRRRLVLPDQDVISGLYGERILPLDPYRYNMTERLFLFRASGYRKINLDWVWGHSAIIHYCGRNKPWKPHYAGKLDCFFVKYSHLAFPQEPETL